MKKVFIDCGGNQGQGLRQFIELLNIDSNWIVESYEPNDHCELEKHVSEFDFVTPHPEAVWIHNGKISFYRTIANEKSYNQSLGSSINGLNWYDATHYDQDIIEVDCVDISDILNKYDKDDYIAMKLDIEGAEFDVVRKLIDDNTITKINDLYVEWHTHHVHAETVETTDELKEKVKSLGVNLHDWY